MLVQLKRYLRELQLPFQSLNPSRYVQVPSRYQIVSITSAFTTINTVVFNHTFLSLAVPQSPQADGTPDQYQGG